MLHQKRASPPSTIPSRLPEQASGQRAVASGADTTAADTSRLRLNQVVGLDLLADRHHLLPRKILGGFARTAGNPPEKCRLPRRGGQPQDEQFRVMVFKPVPNPLRDKDRRALLERHLFIVQRDDATAVQHINHLIPAGMHMARNPNPWWHQLGAKR